MGLKAFRQDLDVVRFVRRFRMHGFGLHFLMTLAQRNNAATLAFSKPLQPDQNSEVYKQVKYKNDIASIKDPWYYIENLG